MLRVRRSASLAFTVAVLASCSQLVGLDDLEPDEEGTGGTALSSGATGGDDDGGSSGSGGKGGSSGGKGGSGGSKGGRPGEGGEGGEDSSGGSTSAGGTKSSGGAGGVSGSGGTTPVPVFEIPEDCSEVIEITSLTLFAAAMDEELGSAEYSYVASPSFGDVFDDILRFQAYTEGTYNGEQTGTFVLDGGPDASFVTCSRCILTYEDDADLPNFLAMGGTITIASDSEHLENAPNITLSDVTLVESTIMGTAPFTSTPVENARCLHIESALLNEGAPPRPAAWACEEDYWFDGYCDCGCDTHDVDCETDDILECFDCYCTGGLVCSDADPALCVPEPEE